MVAVIKSIRNLAFAADLAIVTDEQKPADS